MKGHKRFSETQLKQMAQHVMYEINEYRQSMQELSGTRRGKPEWNRTLESVLLHLRVLRDFFFCEGSNPRSDVFACHYIQSWNPPSPNSIFNQTKVAISKRLAHLTIERLEDDPSAQWKELDPMKDAMEGLILDFRNKLTSSCKQWFADLDTAIVVASLGAADNSTQSF